MAAGTPSRISEKSSLSFSDEVRPVAALLVCKVHRAIGSGAPGGFFSCGVNLLDAAV
jgi:hypothetical protein